MANSTFFQDRAAAQKGAVDVWCVFTAGTSGAVPSTLTNRQGITSVVLTSTGKLTINLLYPFPYAFHVSGTIEQATLSNTTAFLVTPNVDTDVTSATAPKLVFNLLAQDAVSGLFAATNMASGDVFRCTLTAGNLRL